MTADELLDKASRSNGKLREACRGGAMRKANFKEHLTSNKQLKSKQRGIKYLAVIN